MHGATGTRVRHKRARPSASFLFRVLLGVLAILGCARHALADDIEYVYDDAGRLRQASNLTTGTADLYDYDEAGNILSVVNQPLGTLSISNLSPISGPPGTSVEISGTGFSTTPGANLVSFNGSAATVLTATARRLTVNVPATATSGPVAVTVGSNTATSAQLFTVTSAALKPIITSFSPAMGAPGSALTISGSGFENTPFGNRVRVNATPAVVQAATTTSLGITVPAKSSSGKIRIMTPRGEAISANDFFVLPSGYSASNVGSTGRVAVGGAAESISLASSSQVGLRLFEGKAGDLLTIGVSNLTLGSSTLKIFAPDGALLTTGTVTASGQGVQLPKLPLNGTYSILVESAAGSGALSLSLVAPVIGTLSPGGTPVSLDLTPPGRRSLLTFAGTQNAYVTLDLSSVTLTAGTLIIFAPDGSTLTSAQFGTTGTSLQPQLPMTGTYTVLIDPTGAVGGSVTAALTSSTTPELVLNQTPYSVPLSDNNPVDLTFRASAGQYLSLGVTEPCMDSYITGASIAVFGPDGVQMVSDTISSSAGCGTTGNTTGRTVENLGPLTTGGTYRVRVQRTSGGNGTLVLTPSTPVTGTLTTSAATSLVSLSRDGQGLLYSFEGAAGQYLSLGVNESGQPNAGNFLLNASITIFKPDGSVDRTRAFAAQALSCLQCSYDGSVALNLGRLKSSGTYRVLIQQVAPFSAIPNAALALTLSAPVSGTLAVDGAGSTVSLSRPGQSLLYTFDASAGQRLSFAVAESGQPGAGNSINIADVVVIAPNGDRVAADALVAVPLSCLQCSWDGRVTVNVGPLSKAGTYSLLVQQSDTARTATLGIVASTPVSGAIAIDGAISVANIARLGQGATYTFTGALGQRLALAVTEGQGCTVGNTQMIQGTRVTVLKPDGSTLQSSNFAATPCTGVTGGFTGSIVLNLAPLAVAGVYTVVVEQSIDAGTAALGLLLSTPLTGSMDINGTPPSVNLARPGQGLQYTFSGAAGATLTVGVYEGPCSSTSGQLMIVSGTLAVLDPAGNLISSSPFNAAECAGITPGFSGQQSVTVGPLPASGTYSALFLQSGSAGTGILYTSVAGSATSTTVTGTPNPVLPGNDVTFTATVSGNGPTGQIIFKADTTVLATVPLSSGSASYTTNSLPVLPTGVYSITAAYSGDARNAPSTSAVFKQAVLVPQATTTTFASAPTTIIVGHSGVLTAQVQPTSGTVLACDPLAGCGVASFGRVRFVDGSTPIGEIAVTGNASAGYTATLYGWAPSVTGTHNVTAQYLGSGATLPSSASTTVTVNDPSPTTTTFDVIPATAYPGLGYGIAARVAPSAGGNLACDATLGCTTGSYGFIRLLEDGVTVDEQQVLYESGNGYRVHFSWTPATPGTKTLTAQYLGTTPNLPSAVSANVTVNPPATSSTALTVTPGATYTGQTVQLKATVTTGGPTGTSANVTFRDGATVLGTVSYNSAYSSWLLNVNTTAAPLSAGAHSITATYEGNSANASSTSSAVALTINQQVTSTVALTASPTGAVYPSSSVLLTATVSATLSPNAGTVTFREGSTVLGTVSYNSAYSGWLYTVNSTTTPLTPGSHSYTATFDGVPSVSSSTSSALIVPVNAPATSTTALVLSATSVYTAQAVQLKATVSSPGPTPTTASLTFRDGATVLGTVSYNSAYAAWLLDVNTTSAPLAPGAHSITATYEGNAGNASSTSPAVGLTVSPQATSTTALTASPTGAVYPSASVLLKATVTSTLSPNAGTVTFREGSTVLGTVSYNSAYSGWLYTVNSTTTPLTPGSHSYTATFDGVPSVSSSTSSALIVPVNSPATSTTALVLSASTAYTAQTVQLKATVSSPGPTPTTATVTFRDGSTVLGTATYNSAYTAWLLNVNTTTAPLTPGSHSITATYDGNAGNAASTSAASTLTISAPSSSSTTLTASPTGSVYPGSSVQLKATVAPTSPSPTAGTVTFRDGSTVLGTSTYNTAYAGWLLNVNTTAQPLSAGSHAITATFDGVPSVAPSTSSAVTIPVDTPASTTTSVSVSPATVASSSWFTVAASVNSSTALGLRTPGTVTFRAGSIVLATVSYNTAYLDWRTSVVVSSAGLSPGSYAITATYNGTPSNASSTSSAVTLTVN